MKSQLSIALFVSVLLGMVLLSQNVVSADEPNWYPFVVARGADRIAIQNTPVHQRPNRPMHIYGNAVRRSYQRGTAVPSPREILRPSGNLRSRFENRRGK